MGGSGVLFLVRGTPQIRVSRLAQKIASLIEAQGPIPVSQFMMLALHDPEDGVYGARNAIGREGDFVTAPEISQMFGELIGLWFVDLWRRQGNKGRIRLVELGPGRGTLMKDLLRAVRLDPAFLAALDIVLIETSPALRSVQQQTLAGAPAAIRWSARLSDALEPIPLYVMANEFFDALPVRQYVKTETGWHERMVVVENGRLAFALAPVPAHGLAIPESRGEAAKGAVFETSAAATALAEELAAHIAHHGGGALIVDYGYAGAGFGETLQAVARHKPAAVLELPGTADLSAHVDFAALAAAAVRGGATVYGPVTQGAFLRSLGIALRAERLKERQPRLGGTIEAGMRRLTADDEMGTLFKAMALLPGGAPPPAGF